MRGRSSTARARRAVGHLRVGLQRAGSRGNYQYRAFGVPGLGLKRGLADDLVVAPYATLLAAPLAPARSLANLERCAPRGLLGPLRLLRGDRLHARAAAPRGQRRRRAADLHGAPPGHEPARARQPAERPRRCSAASTPTRACRRPSCCCRSASRTLVPLKNPPIERPSTRRRRAAPSPPPVRRYVTPHTLSPRGAPAVERLLRVMVTNAGGGYSRRQDLAMTRWREDITTRRLGHASATCATSRHRRRLVDDLPADGARADEYEVTFALDRAVFRRVDGDIETRTEIVVSPGGRRRAAAGVDHQPRRRAAEPRPDQLRRGRAGARERRPRASGVQQPVRRDDARAGARRAALRARPRGGGDRRYLVHVLSGRGARRRATEYETDRARFIGRGADARATRARCEPGALCRTPPGRCSIRSSACGRRSAAARRHARSPFTTGFAETEAARAALIEKYHDRAPSRARSRWRARTARSSCGHLGLTVEDTIRFQRLGGRLLYGDPRLRAADAVRGQPARPAELWKYGISGDLPILLVRIDRRTGCRCCAICSRRTSTCALKG